MKNQLSAAVEVLNNGGVLIFPTDTVYGIGCKADKIGPIERIYKIKGTAKDQQFPRLVSNLNQVESEVEINDAARDLIRRYWPGALTIVFCTRDGKSKIGFRMPNSNLIINLINKVKSPLIGTSANFHGFPAPKKYEEIDKKLLVLADFTLKGNCKLKKESTVVDVSQNKPIVLRLGAVKINN